MLIILSLVGVILIHFIVFNRRGLLDPVSVFFVAYLYYSYFTPVTMYLFGQFDFDILNRTDWVSDYTLNRSSILSFLGYLGYSLAYAFVSRNSEFESYKSKNASIGMLFSDTYIRIIFSAIVSIGLIIILFFSRNLEAATQSYEGKIAGNYEGSTYAFLLSVSLTLISLLANYFILNSRNYLLSTAAGVGLFFMIALATFSKGPFIYAALCVFCFLYRYRRVPSWVSLLSIATAGIVALVFVVPAFAAYRSTGLFTLTSGNAVSLNTIYSDAAGPFGIINFALNGYIDASPYPLWQSYVLWIPRAIWVDRPLDFAEGFAREVFVGWQPGYGLGFSPLAEGYARMGLWGSGFFMALVGATSAFVQSIFARFLQPTIRVPAMLTVGGFVAVLVLRGAYSGLLTQSIQLWVPIVIVGLFARELVRRIDGPASGAAGYQMRPE